MIDKKKKQSNLSQLIVRVVKWEVVKGGRAEQAITIGYVAVLLLSMLAVYLTANYVAHWFLFNADSLWIEDYLRDWLVRGIDMRTWLIPGAPNYFPEMLIYGLFRFITGSVYWGFIGFGITKITLCVIIFYGLVSLVSDISRIRRLRFSILCISLILIFIIILGNQYNYFRLPDFWQLFIPAAHGGAILNSLIAIYLILLWLQKPAKSFLLLSLLFLLSLAASLSDMLFVIWFVLPALGAAVILKLLNQISLRSLLWLSSVLLISVILSRIIIVWVFPLQVVSYRPGLIAGLQSTINFYRILFKENWYHPFVLISYICLTWITIRDLLFAWKTRNTNISPQTLEPQELTKLFLLPFSTLVLPTSFFAMALINRPETQYFTGGNLLAISLWAFLLIMNSSGLKLWAKGWFHVVIISVLVGYFSFLYITIPYPLKTYFLIPNPYSELVSCLDSHVKEFNGGAGLADYWQARSINLFSEKGLRIDQANGDNLAVFQWASNQEMFEDRKHTFVLTNTPTNLPKILEEDVIRLHGQPDTRFVCTGYPVLVYLNGLDATLPPRSVPLPVTMIDSHQNFIIEKFHELILREKMQMFTYGGIWRQDSLYSSGEAGWLLYGPYTTLPSGSYRIEWKGEVISVGQEEIGTVDIAYGGGTDVLTRMVITKDSLVSSPQGQIAVLEFSLGKDTPLIEFRFYVNEKTKLLINEIAIFAIKP